MKLGVIGSGPIVPFHLDALTAVGFDVKAIASRSGSVTTQELAKKYSAKSFDSFHEILKLDIDAVLIAPASNAIEAPLKAFITRKIPVLVEKPVLKNSKLFKEIGDLYNQNVMVGYNRRFYSSVQELKTIIKSKTPQSFLFKVPENSWNGDLDLQGRINFLIDNTVHMVDLLRYLVGGNDIKVDFQKGIHGENIKFVNMFIEGSDFSGMFQVTFDSPGAYSVEFNGNGYSSKLQPIEYLTTYDAIEVIEPTSEIPIRRYQPKQSDKRFSISELDLKFKPGFYQQSKAFANLVQGKPSLIAANLYDAFRAIEIVEQASSLRGEK